ncbi:Methyltransferase type 11 [Candidatus Zixiibacteriota bacterium]|nr:Methyltransferase type 11 [candidate division Zixibacteria bacterium]
MATRKREWFDDESYWRELYSFMFSEKRMAVAAEEIKKVIRLAKPKGKRVLDLCCGPGRFSVALAKRHFRVTGVDRTKYLLDKAKTRAKKAGVKIEWVRKDMRDFVSPNSFDLVLNTYTSFGYFQNKGEDLQVLKNIYDSLRPGGVCLIDTMGKERLAKIFPKTAGETLDDGSLLVHRHEIIDDWTRIRNEWILIRKNRAKRFKFDLTIYSGQELKDRMERIGFRDLELYGDMDGAEYGPKAERLIIIGRKGKER